MLRGDETSRPRDSSTPMGIMEATRDTAVRQTTRPDSHPGLLVNVRVAAAMLSIGRSTLYELVDRGEIRVVHIGRSVRIPVDELKRFVQDSK